MEDDNQKPNPNDPRFSIEIKLVHEGEINKARYMPQLSSIIATKTVNGEVHLFDYTQHPAKPIDAVSKPLLRCIGHTGEGLMIPIKFFLRYGLAWNSKRAGYLLSGSNDQLICLWDIEGPSPKTKQILPYQ